MQVCIRYLVYNVYKKFNLVFYSFLKNYTDTKLQKIYSVNFDELIRVFGCPKPLTKSPIKALIKALNRPRLKPIIKRFSFPVFFKNIFLVTLYLAYQLEKLCKKV